MKTYKFSELDMLFLHGNCGSIYMGKKKLVAEVSYLNNISDHAGVIFKFLHDPS